MSTCDMCHENHLWEADTGICQDCHATQADEISQGLMTGCNWCHADHAFDAALAETLCAECHATPPEDASASWESAPGAHEECTNCHLSHVFGLGGGDTDALCGTCHQMVVEPTQTAGMPSCISCHQFPHLPMLQLSIDSCAECHGTIAANLSGSSKENCFLCHESHTWSGSSSTCASCHSTPAQELAGSGMADCALCHSDHEYDSSSSFDNCTTCHPRPLPALHEVKRHKNTDCDECHSAHYFGLTGRELCLSCHKNRTNHNPGTACAKCHSFTD